MGAIKVERLQRFSRTPGAAHTPSARVSKYSHHSPGCQGGALSLASSRAGRWGWDAAIPALGQIRFCTCASALANSEGAASTALSAAAGRDSAASCIF